MGGEIGVAEIDQARFKILGHLVDLNQLEFTVVEDNPDHWQFVLDRSHQLEARQRIATVAATDDDRPLGVRDLQADRPVGVPRHWTELPSLPKMLAAFQL